MLIAEYLETAGCPSRWLATMELLLYHHAHDGLQDNVITAIAEEFVTKREDVHILRDVLFRCSALMHAGIKDNWKEPYQ